MKKFIRWYSRSLIRELKKGKYYAILRYFIDQSYRRDINHIFRLTTAHKLRSHYSTMPLGDILPSHDINYPSWVDSLESEMATKAPYLEIMTPIKVMFDHTRETFDGFSGAWIVIDGNHRLAALNRIFLPTVDVPVQILYSDVALPEFMKRMYK